jgi:hypothetical protein
VQSSARTGYRHSIERERRKGGLAYAGPSFPCLGGASPRMPRPAPRIDGDASAYAGATVMVEMMTEGPRTPVTLTTVSFAKIFAPTGTAPNRPA